MIRKRLWLFVAVIIACASLAGTARASSKTKGAELNGYAEWRQGDLLIVEGQRVAFSTGARFKGKDEARSFASIPLGYEVKVKGDRQPDGIVIAREVEAKPNGDAMFEGELKQAFDQMEQQYRKEGHMFEPVSENKVADMGVLKESGPEVARVRRIAAKITPPYLKPEDFRVYVVENKEWNAMAAPNKSIYVFSGLLKDMDDDEVAIVLGHELVHATHEHSRKQYKNAIWVQLAAIGAIGVAEETMDSETARAMMAIVAGLGLSAWQNGYGRGNEDQADRVGLRYAHQGGFDVYKGPRLWGRFAEKYGNPDKVTNFFFGDHSVAKDRQRNLDQEIKLNYAQAVKASVK